MEDYDLYRSNVLYSPDVVIDVGNSSEDGGIYKESYDSYSSNVSSPDVLIDVGNSSEDGGIYEESYDLRDSKRSMKF